MDHRPGWVRNRHRKPVKALLLAFPWKSTGFELGNPFTDKVVAGWGQQGQGQAHAQADK